MKRLFRKVWPFRSSLTQDAYVLQQAARLASRGPRSTLFHLLFPICLIASFISLFLLPRFIAGHVENIWISEPLSVYIKWSLPVLIVVNLIVFSWARNKLLAPHIKELTGNKTEK